MVDYLAGVAIVMAGLYLAALGTACLVRPTIAEQFLLAFVGSPFVHFVEMALRILVGAAFVQKAPQLPCDPIFMIAGWVLLLTSIVLLAMPWRWHRQFASQAVPLALRYIKLLGAASIGLGSMLVAAVVFGSTR